MDRGRYMETHLMSSQVIKCIILLVIMVENTGVVTYIQIFYDIHRTKHVYTSSCSSLRWGWCWSCAIYTTYIREEKRHLYASSCSSSKHGLVAGAAACLPYPQAQTGNRGDRGERGGTTKKYIREKIKSIACLRRSKSQKFNNVQQT